MGGWGWGLGCNISFVVVVSVVFFWGICLIIAFKTRSDAIIRTKGFLIARLGLYGAKKFNIAFLVLWGAY
ncbi:hypothetical protein, partial [Escherichia coli]|uniref:hypothetical protein n=1 Tax=Escherichia coli TaxID=562 RepID=UPI002915D3AD